MLAFITIDCNAAMHDELHTKQPSLCLAYYVCVCVCKGAPTFKLYIHTYRRETQIVCARQSGGL